MICRLIVNKPVVREGRECIVKKNVDFIAVVVFHSIVLGDRESMMIIRILVMNFENDYI